MKKTTLLFIIWCGLHIVPIAGQQVKTQKDTTAVKVDSLWSKTLDEVTVTARRQVRQDIGSTQIGQVQLAKEMTSDIRDLIRYIPGVSISYSGTRGGTRGFAIRGVEANRVAISVDGIQQPEVLENMVFSAYGLSNASRVEFDPYFVSAVDIQKGAASFSVGSGALGGAVNYSTKRPGDLIQPGKEYGVTVQGNYNGKDRMRMYLAGAGFRKKQWDGLVMFADRHGSEIQNFGYGELSRNVTTTQVDPMSYNQQTLLAKIGFTPGIEHRFDFHYYMLNKRVDSEIWSQEPLDIFTSADKPYYYGHDQTLSHSFTLSYSYVPEFSWIRKINVNTNLQDIYLDAATWSEYYRPNFYGGGSYELIYEGRRDKYRGQEVRDKMVKATLDLHEINSPILGRHNFSLTASIANRYNDSRNVDVERPVAFNNVDGYTVRMGKRYEFGEPMGTFINAYSFQRPIDRLNYHFSLVDNIRLSPRLDVYLGARYDLFRTRDRGWDYHNDTYYIDYLMQHIGNVEMNQSRVNDTDKGISWLGTANYRFSDYLNIAYKFSTGFRVPTTEERYFQYFNSWPSFLVLSNRDLKPETSINHEVEIAGNGNLGTYVINLYHTGYTDFIDIEQGTIQVVNELDNSTKNLSYAKNVNRASADLWGLDAKLHVQLEEIYSGLRGFRVNAAAGYAKGSTSYGTSMLGVQPLTGFAGLEYLSRDQRWNVNLVANLFQAKKREETRFIESTAQREIHRTFPGLFLNDAYTFDFYGYYQFTPNLTLRAGIYNIFNTKYWRWDDLRQLTNPALLPHIENFFREGTKTISRFSQPKRYVSASLEFTI